MNLAKGKKRITVSVVTALMMVMVMVPGTAFANTAGNTALSQTSQNQGMFVNYIDASVNSKDSRIGQYGTTNIKQYFFNGADIEKENGGMADDSHPYVNSYGYNYSIMTDTSVSAYWDNYIQGTLNPTQPIKFGFFLGGSQTAKGSDQIMANNIIPKMSIQKTDGTVVLTGTQIYKGWKHQRLANGGGTGSGPLRGFDVFLEIPANALAANTQYVLVFESGMGVQTLLDKKIVFHFSTDAFAQSLSLGSKVTLKEGQTKTLKADIKPENVKEKAVTWTSADKAVAAVDSNGEVKAMKAGKTTITAVTKDGTNLKASCPVEVTPVIAKVSLKAVSSSYNRVKLTWSKAAKADGYTVYRYNSKSKKYKPVKHTTARSYVGKNLKTGKTYAYKVRAYRLVNGQKVYGSYSAKKSIRPVPSKPALKVKAGKRKAAAKWSKVSGADKYVLYRSTSKNGKYIKASITVKNKYTDTGLKKGKRYYYKVRAYKVVDGKKVYGKTSQLKTVKVK